MIEIHMRRAHMPEEMGAETCALCALPFEGESVRVEAFGASGVWGDVGAICTTCLAYLNERNPEQFPYGVADYEAWLELYPEPIFETDAAALEQAQRDIAERERITDAGELTRT